jgi:hypothetical protein
VQASEQGIRHFDGSLGHGVRVFKHEALKISEVMAGTIVGQLCNLLGGDPMCPADGRADVNSKWAANQGRGPQFGQPLQLCIHQFAG